MIRIRTLVRTTLALGLLGAASAAFASSPYTVMPVSGVAMALSPTGQVISQSTSLTQTQAAYSVQGSEAGWWDLYTTQYSISGPNATGPSTSLGTSSYIGSESVPVNFDNQDVSLPGQSNVFSAPNALGVTVTPAFSVVGINGSGAIAANVGGSGGITEGTGLAATPAIANQYAGGPFTGFTDEINANYPVAEIANSNGTVTQIQGWVGGINSSGAVSVANQTNFGTMTSTVQTSVGATLGYLAAGSTTPTVISDLGYGGNVGGLNDLGQVTGGFDVGYQSYCTSNGSPPWTCTNNYNTRAFRTGDNGVGTQVFGTANGVSSFGNVINNSGQVGGYITLASGQNEAFLTTAHGGLMVGLGAGAATDSTSVAFLNNYGQAIISDSTTNAEYLYSAGYVVPITSLGAPANDAVVGFNDAGQILLQDPALFSPTSSSFGSASAMASYTGATSITSTSTYQQVAAAQSNTTPDATFFSSPTTSTDTVSTQSVSGPGVGTLSSASTSPSQFTPSAGVPEPATWALLLLGGLAAFGLRRRRGIDEVYGIA